MCKGHSHEKAPRVNSLRELMHLVSFWTIWFWVTHAVAWSLASHFTLGVPYDMVVQANREKDDEGPWSRHCEALILAQVYRFMTYYRRAGVLLAGVSAFILAALLTIAIQVDLELAWAAFSIMGPLTLIYIFSIRAAARMEAQELRGQPLRDALRRQRFWNQIIGLLGIVMAVALAIWQTVKTMSLF